MNHLINRTQKTFDIINKLKETNELCEEEVRFMKGLSAIELAYISDVLYHNYDYKTAAMLWEIIKNKAVINED